MKWFLLFALAFLFAADCLAQSQCQQNVNPNRVMYAARYRVSGTVVVSAHRGYWEYALEGSAASIDAAVAICSEMVEMDMRVTSDNIPVPRHDWGLERITSGTGYIYDITNAAYRNLFMRDRTGALTTTPVQTLNDYLDKMVQFPSLVMVLDCKDSIFAKTGMQRTYPTSYQVMKFTYQAIAAYEDHAGQTRGTLLDRIIFKIRYPEIPVNPNTVLTDLGISTSDVSSKATHLNIVPIWYFDDTNKKDDTGQLVYPNMSAIVHSYTDLLVSTNSSFVWYPEAVVNYPGALLQSQIAAAASLTPSGNVTAFSPTPDWPEGTSQGSGLCCRTRDTQFPLSIGSNGTISSTFTGDFEYLWFQGFHWFSTDKVPDAIAYLQARGQRNTAYFSGPDLY